MGNVNPLADVTYSIPLIGPLVVAQTLTGTAAQVLPYDVGRRAAWFHNPGNVDIYVQVSGSGGFGGTFVGTPGAIGGAFRIPSLGDLFMYAVDDHQNFSSPWVAWSSSAPSPITILNFTDLQPPGSSRVIWVDAAGNAHTPLVPNNPQPLPTQNLTQGSSIPSPVGRGFNVNTSNGNDTNPAFNSNTFANLARRGIILHNPDTTHNLAFCPADQGITASIGAGSLVLGPGTTKCIVGPSNTKRVRATCGWLAMSTATPPATSPGTVVEIFG